MFTKKISISGVALSAGILVAIHLSLLSLLGMMGVGNEIVELLAGLLPGYEASGAGIFLGATWGFLIGSLYGAIFAFFYERMK